MGLLCASFTTIPTHITADNAVSLLSIRKKIKVLSEASQVYNTCNLEQYGLSEQAFDYAWKGYNYLLERKRISRQNYLTICDLGQSSLKKRLYIIDIVNNKLLVNTYVAHGKNSGLEYANQFSNKPESLETSLGFYITANTYDGKHGLSLRLNGVDPGFNDKAMERTIVIHGANYVDASRVNIGYMGRSWGCPAVPQKESANIITTIKNGTCLFIYHPTKSYLFGSKILNG